MVSIICEISQEVRTKKNSRCFTSSAVVVPNESRLDNTQCLFRCPSAATHSYEKESKLQTTSAKRRIHRRLLAIATGALVAAAAFVPTGGRAEAQTANASLTNEQRRSYLNYYAPIVFKRGNGNHGAHGLDWITNFDFDRDGSFSNNKTNFRSVGAYIDNARARTGAYSNWRIRPTLYTSLIEFQADGGKNLKLIYHVYHALDKNALGSTQLHDWERIEMLVRNVGVNPGAGEYVDYAVVTQHGRNVVRPGSQVRFYSTATGRHLMIWQAEWSNKLGAAHGNELRFVQDSDAYVRGRFAVNGKAELDVNNDSGRKNVHYAFLPEASSSAVAEFGAAPITYESADRLASRYDNGNTVGWAYTKRVTYELQDLADIVSTHWAGGNYQQHWLTAKFFDVLFESPIANEGGAVEVPTGLQRLYVDTRDIEGSDTRDGYPAKHWFWGTFKVDLNASDFGGSSGSFTAEALANTVVDGAGLTRTAANGQPASAGSYFWQHDYFVHDSSIAYTGDGSPSRGRWLVGDWYTPAKGGFDGRFVQLFDDRTALAEPVVSPPSPPAGGGGGGGIGVGGCCFQEP